MEMNVHLRGRSFRFLVSEWRCGVHHGLGLVDVHGNAGPASRETPAMLTCLERITTRGRFDIIRDIELLFGG